MEPADRRLRGHAGNPRRAGSRADGLRGTPAGDRVGTAALPRLPRPRGGVGRRPRGGDRARGVSRHDGGRHRGRWRLRSHRPGVAPRRRGATGLLQDRARGRRPSPSPTTAPSWPRPPPLRPAHHCDARAAPRRRDHRPHPARRAVLPEHGKGATLAFPGDASTSTAVRRAWTSWASRSARRRPRGNADGEEGGNRLAGNEGLFSVRKAEPTVGAPRRSRSPTGSPAASPARAPPSPSKVGAPASPAA